MCSLPSLLIRAEAFFEGSSFTDVMFWGINHISGQFPVSVSGSGAKTKTLSDLNLNLFQIFLYHFIQEFFQISIISDFLL